MDFRLFGFSDFHLDRVGAEIGFAVDEVAVFNYAFTPAQVLNLYNSALQAPVTLSIQRVGANVVLSWPQGTLLQATNVTGPYATNNATSPYTNAPTAARKFFKVIVQ